MKIEYYLSNKKARKLIWDLCIKKSFLGYFFLILNFIGIFLITIGLILVVPNTIKVFQTNPSYIIFVAIFLSGIFIFFFNRWFVDRKVIEHASLKNAKLSYQIYPDKLVHLTNGGFKFELTPKEILSFKEYEKYLFFFIRKNYAYYIPPSAFANDIQKDEFKKQVKKLLKNKT